MAGRSKSEENDAFDDVTPDKPVSIFDLDEDLPTRAQTSEEIAQFQKLAREKREAAAFKAFGKPKEGAPTSTPPRDSSPSSPGAGPSNRPVPRESGPIRITRLPPSAPVPEPEEDLESLLTDVAAGLERLPPAPRVPVFEPGRESLETIDGSSSARRSSENLPGASTRSARSGRWAWALALALIVIGAAAAAFFLVR